MSPLTHRVSRSTVYVLVVIYLSMAAMVAASILYSNYVSRVNEQKWCHLLVTLDSSYRANPPQTPAGRNVAADIHRLLADLRCGSKR